ncbi:hypothetical protein [Luteirhabdus pelagi]|uniref:hypothetical protein n=1 Tax=Luteirhabdus pelagi TaxID=2792783 RepID=UPI0019399BBA|nr:hypothetical protein [Luteirhabdus pelagi]
MKLLYSLIAILLVTVTSVAQNGLYVKYETDVSASTDEGEMMGMMMDGTTMELAMSEERTWVKTQMGTMMTMTMQHDTKTEEMKMLMTGMMGKMAFQGNPDVLEEEAEAVAAEVDLKFFDQTKMILGQECKKAVITSAEGNETIFWYTEKFDRPEGLKQMPNQIPGLCLEMEVPVQEGVLIKYTAIELKNNTVIDQYTLEFPEGTEVKSLEEMATMGVGGK